MSAPTHPTKPPPTPQPPAWQPPPPGQGQPITPTTWGAGTVPAAVAVDHDSQGAAGLAAGWSIDVQTDFGTQIDKDHGVNHLLHLILFAVELPDATVHLIPAVNVHAAIDEAERRIGCRPSFVWLMSAERRMVMATD